MKIREFLPKDLKRIHDIELMSFNQSYGIDMFKKLYDIGTGFLVCEINEYVVGYIIFWIKEEGLGHIISLAVDKNYRNLEVASKLLTKAILIFKNAGIDLITLEVNVNNEKAINFYKKFDFTVDREVPGYYENNEAALVMFYKIN
ncbi:GNAT family N-acetyltransferase [Methanobrevibacter sp. OttesenSCG-928-K11]|nr:GNAT family N-acetyltransferase [Methanobrevibacter sp. OttesenSCG-928-K11]MDL2270176.1 GNAT family N-acetyltransferase [Methanobrevibacter sp. OttesenSCG-928-I08]